MSILNNKLIILLSTIILIIPVGRANAHATLERVTPELYLGVESSGDDIVLGFNESVKVDKGNIKVVDSKGKIIYVNNQSFESPEVRIPTSKFKKGYLVLYYRVTSQDGHILKNSIVFPYNCKDKVSRTGKIILKNLKGEITSAIYTIGNKHSINIKLPISSDPLSIKIIERSSGITQEREGVSGTTFTYRNSGLYDININVKEDKFTSTNYRGELKI